MTNVFLLDSDPRFRSLLPPETDTFVDVAKQFDGTPIGDPWTPFSVEYDPDSPHLPAGDFPGLLLPHIPVFSRRAAEALESIIKLNGELLPLKTHNAAEFYAFNVTSVVSARSTPLIAGPRPLPPAPASGPRRRPFRCGARRVSRSAR